MNKIAIFGASGFVGSTLAEELLAEGVPVRCLIHSSGNAWRLSRHRIDLQMVDLLDPASVRRAIADCSHVVNCSRGKGEAMTVGAKNLIDVCAEANVERFVHISSVAVYGDAFSVPVISEDHATTPEHGSYGWKKLKQDEMVQRAFRRGLNSVVVCPPNISGPYSMFLEEICRELKAGTFAFVDEGRFPCPLIDVGNLTHALRQGLNASEGDGQRRLVCDEPTATWREVVTALSEMLEISNPIPSVTSAEAEELTRSKRPQKGSIKKSMGHLVSSGVRMSLRQDPYIGSLEKFAVNCAKRLPKTIQDQLRDDQKRISPVVAKPNVSVRLLSQQLRNVTYSCDAAKKAWGYDPPIDFAESMDRFQQWAKLHWGLGSAPYQLLAELR
ncbi:hypothetical protein Mal15_37020 [Stieleria maiorica]|uniref:NAD-dependent epimerase/dehydratase domain-containing protein n=1 Tax=Stieleria maiorica TaxID=2795974 RepID=A0A5B9MHW5_9BACT|nr:NAD-dependent epimerase/dehydratase family protein [Stieleria maiorica]QEF99636.1 hypothetical protein Mal15_37020 [Stieleria maiorica]